MDKNYILHIAESKTKYHNQQANILYEEKFKIVLELQKIDIEMRKNNKPNDKISRKYKVWRIE